MKANEAFALPRHDTGLIEIHISDDEGGAFACLIVTPAAAKYLLSSIEKALDALSEDQ